VKVAGPCWAGSDLRNLFLHSRFGGCEWAPEGLAAYIPRLKKKVFREFLEF
jgi:hypothetical protein